MLPWIVAAMFIAHKEHAGRNTGRRERGSIVRRRAAEPHGLDSRSRAASSICMTMPGHHDARRRPAAEFKIDVPPQLDLANGRHHHILDTGQHGRIIGAHIEAEIEGARHVVMPCTAASVWKRPNVTASGMPAFSCASHI